jgi:hypothetical protein
MWGLRPDFYYCQKVAGLLMWGDLSVERTGLSFKIAAGSRQRSHPRVRVPLALATIFYFLRFESSIFVASYDSHGCRGGIRPSLHTTVIQTQHVPCRKNSFFYCCVMPLLGLPHDRLPTVHWRTGCCLSIENTLPIVACAYFGRGIEMDVLLLLLARRSQVIHRAVA